MWHPHNIDNHLFNNYLNFKVQNKVGTTFIWVLNYSSHSSSSEDTQDLKPCSSLFVKSVCVVQPLILRLLQNIRGWHDVP